MSAEELSKNEQKNAVVLLSGGLDSTTTLAVAQSEGFTVHALSFDYGQRNVAELLAAKKVVQAMHVAEHKIVTIDSRLFGGSALTDTVDVPKNNPHAGDINEIPVTYVPARNTIFLSFGLAYAETIGSFDIFIGANAVDYSGYPDCRPAYIEAFENMANLATAATVSGERRLRIRRPLIDLTKAQIIQKGQGLGVDYGLTLSCYDPTPDGAACGACDSCLLRQKGFAENGVSDPAIITGN
jgi:7-cyano-7-deazaguanine synthase